MDSWDQNQECCQSLLGPLIDRSMVFAIDVGLLKSIDHSRDLSDCVDVLKGKKYNIFIDKYKREVNTLVYIYYKSKHGQLKIESILPVGINEAIFVHHFF